MHINCGSVDKYFAHIDFRKKKCFKTVTGTLTEYLNNRLSRNRYKPNFVSKARLETFNFYQASHIKSKTASKLYPYKDQKILYRILIYQFSQVFLTHFHITSNFSLVHNTHTRTVFNKNELISLS